jgi:hypothetical protein
MACFALVLKFFYAGGLITTPVLRILSPAVVAEGVLLLARRPGPARYAVAGAVAVTWTLAQSFLFPAIFAPQGLRMVYAITLIRGAGLLHATTLSAPVLLALAAAGHLLLGALAGLVGWGVGRVPAGKSEDAAGAAAAPGPDLARAG